MEQEGEPGFGKAENLLLPLPGSQHGPALESHWDGNGCGALGLTRKITHPALTVWFMGKQKELSVRVAVFIGIPRQTWLVHDVWPSFQAGGVHSAVNQGNN